MAVGRECHSHDSASMAAQCSAKACARDGIDYGYPCIVVPIDSHGGDIEPQRKSRVSLLRTGGLRCQKFSDSNPLLMLGLRALEVGYDRQHRSEQNQHRQCRYHSPDNSAVRRCCRTSSPSISSFGTSRMAATSVATWSRNLGLCRVRPGFRRAQVISEILGLGRENTAKRPVRNGRTEAEITGVVVPDQCASSDDNKQTVCALTGDPMRNLLSDPARPGSLGRCEQDKPARGVKRVLDAGPQAWANRQASLVAEYLHRPAPIPWLRQMLQAPLQDRSECCIGVMGIRDKDVV